MISKSAVLVMCLLLAVFVNSVFAVVYWDNDTGNQMWVFPVNWSGDAGATDNPAIDIGEPGGADECIIDGRSYVSGIERLWMASQSGSSGALLIDGGTLVCEKFIQIAYKGEGVLTIKRGRIETELYDVGKYDTGTSVINMSGGTITTARDFYVGYTGNATLNMVGGEIRTNKFFVAYDNDSSGMVNLDGGTIYASSFVMNDDAVSSSINITEGSVVVDSGLVSQVQDLYYSGRIRAYGGQGNLTIKDDTSNPGKVIISAEPFIDFNHDGFVNMQDFGRLGLAWLSDSASVNYKENYDLEDNNSIDLNDLRIFGKNWLMIGSNNIMPATFGFEAEDFEFDGDWNIVSSTEEYSGTGYLFANPAGSVHAAATAINIPGAGRYYLWVRARDYPDYYPATRKFTVSVDGTISSELFGDSGQPDWTWEPGGSFYLAGGPVLIGIHDVDYHYGRCDAMLLTNDAGFVPSGELGSGVQKRVEPLVLSEVTNYEDPLAQKDINITSEVATAWLENENLRIEFLPSICDGLTSIRPKFLVKDNNEYFDVGANFDSEVYSVVKCSSVSYTNMSYYPIWNGPRQEITLELGNATIVTAIAKTAEAIWNSGETSRFVMRTATMDGNTVNIDFYNNDVGTLNAVWQLKAGENAARVKLNFIPNSAGQYSLGYHAPCRKSLDDVNELLLPMLWNRRRLPEKPYFLFEAFTPTALSLMQTNQAGNEVVWALTGEPDYGSDEWPNPSKSRYGFSIRDNTDKVQPCIYGPIPGTGLAARQAGEAVNLEFRLIFDKGDWYDGFRLASDEVFGLRDYRRNVGTSLTDAALNMVDLIKNDEFGGWWEKCKASYQVESRNTVTEATPLTAISMYRLTGDSDIYERRTLPTIEYLLSRSGAHFSPEPNESVHYSVGNMKGPISIYGTTALGSCWRMSNGMTDALKTFALPGTGVKQTHGYSSSGLYGDWLSRYLLTGEQSSLDQAKYYADEYVQNNIETSPTAVVSYTSFWLISFIPDWSGLLRMYEVTGDNKYLDAASFGAKQLMPGIFTHPAATEDMMTVHPGGDFYGTVPRPINWVGPDYFQLGFPRVPGDTPEHEEPQWLVSDVGLGFEQPSTYDHVESDQDGRMIYQAPWAPDFLRLARYTGDKSFETYARNATLGRWSNYPGYYVKGFTDMPLDPNYPYVGPDVSRIYYHHIPVHFAWTMDYLVADAELLSNGQISFPMLRQTGYAYFNNRLFGYAPGSVYNYDGVWLWLKRGLVELDNCQINYLTGHSNDKFYLILTNQSQDQQTVNVEFLDQIPGFDPLATTQVGIIKGGNPETNISLSNGHCSVTLEGRELAVLILAGVDINLEVHQPAPVLTAGGHPGYSVVNSNVSGIEVRAAAIQVLPGSWDGFIWCTAGPTTTDAEQVTFHYKTDGDWQQQIDTEYPYEMSVEVADCNTPLYFYITGERPGGGSFSTSHSVIGAMKVLP